MQNRVDHRGKDNESTWPGRRSRRASAADMSEGTVWFGTSGVIFTVGMDEKAFIPKLAAGKSPLEKKKTERIKIMIYLLISQL